MRGEHLHQPRAAAAAERGHHQRLRASARSRCAAAGAARLIEPACTRVPSSSTTRSDERRVELAGRPGRSARGRRSPSRPALPSRSATSARGPRTGTRAKHPVAWSTSTAVAGESRPDAPSRSRAGRAGRACVARRRDVDLEAEQALAPLRQQRRPRSPRRCRSSDLRVPSVDRGHVGVGGLGLRAHQRPRSARSRDGSAATRCSGWRAGCGSAATGPRGGTARRPACTSCAGPPRSAAGRGRSPRSRPARRCRAGRPTSS